MSKLMNKPHLYYINSTWLILIAMWSCFLFVACTSSHDEQLNGVDRFNGMSFRSRYRNVDSTRIYALMAYDEARKESYEEGMAKAMLNMAFYHTVRMEYSTADSILDAADSATENDITHLEITVQKMRLCQRRSQNKEFYFQKSYADKLIEKIRGNRDSFSDMDLRRYTYARSEYGIVLSTYLYYVQLYDESSEALLEVGNDPDMVLLSDTAQYIGYLYNIGAGGILRNLSGDELLIKEFNNLMMCYIIARQSGYLYWEANALQSISEHIADPESLTVLRNYDAAALRYLNDDDVPDSLLSEKLAERALQGFVRYGDVYQIAGARRTLSQCYQALGDHQSELNCLLSSMQDTLIYQAPDLIASISEKLSQAYSGLDDKQMSDYYRNLYLDIQDSTRQDRQLEARADELSIMLNKTRGLIAVIIVVLIILSIVVYLLSRRRRKHNYSAGLDSLKSSFNDCSEACQAVIQKYVELDEDLDEQLNVLTIQKEDAIRINVEQHAKISFVRNIMPLIDRMLHAARQCRKNNDGEYLQYVADVCKSIIEYNNSLTRWVQLRKGKITMHIESFSLNDLFEIVSLGKSSFTAKGISLNMPHTSFVVKADRALTLFVINTLLDNARKYSQTDSTVTLSAKESEKYPGFVEICVKDEGKGMTQDEADKLFEYRPIDDGVEDLTSQKSHGFGLMNCRGILSRYKKTSEFFSHCDIFARSEVGKGTSIIFLLPKAVKTIALLLVMLTSLVSPTFAEVNHLSLSSQQDMSNEGKEIVCPEAANLADSVYMSNVNGRYYDAILYADSCFRVINDAYRAITNVSSTDTLTLMSNGADMRWMKSGIVFDYTLIAYVRNEVAVAALAIHDWALYEQNNKTYTALYKECSKDTTLNTYCETMERTKQQYHTSVIILVCLFVVLIMLFWWFYVREVIKRRRSKLQISDLISILHDGYKMNSDDDITNLNVSLSRAISLLADENMESMPNDVHDLAINIRSELCEMRDNLSEILASLHKKKDIVSVMQREKDMVNVSNNVIDNTLSALKHETMYFPSRISNLVSHGITEELLDVITYYRSLYTMLSAQCARNEQYIVYPVSQLPLSRISFAFTEMSEGNIESIKVVANEILMDYLALIIKRKNNKVKPLAQWNLCDSRYVNITVQCPYFSLTDDELADAFSPSSQDVDMLILRQIIRETGGASNSYASGIRLVRHDGVPEFIITLPLFMT